MSSIIQDSEPLREIPCALKYYVSETGKVYSMKSGKLKPISVFVTKQGYLKASIKHTDSKTSGFYVHRLVALTWLPNPQNLAVVNHKDGNKTNANVSNLEWVSHSENSKHACETTNANARLQPEVLQITLDGALVKEHANALIAAKSVGLKTSGPISQCLTGMLKHNKGFFWIRKKDYNPETFSIKPLVGQFDKNGKLLMTFADIPTAKKFVNLDEKTKPTLSFNVLNKHTEFKWRFLVGDISLHKDTHPTEDTENWRETTFNPNYLVSKDGRVFSKINNKMLTLTKTADRFYASLGANIVRQLIHRVVALAFLPNPDNLPLVNHKDGNPANNHISNLEWCTPSHNTKHAYATGLATKMGCKKVIQCDLDGNELNRFDSITDAAKSVNRSSKTLGEVLNRNAGTSAGFIWKWG